MSESIIIFIPIMLVLLLNTVYDRLRSQRAWKSNY